MKKTYIKPSAENVILTSIAVVATSVPVTDEESDANEAWSNENRKEWGNLWK